ncbi:hypothetical protein X742_23335 [Mesorhizobium sp. LNHC232B00]|nr:hypothetical protein X742_23335 [Mesorhizobium sp. LNHC232B00]
MCRRVQRPKSGIAPNVTGDNFGGAITRAVIDDNRLPIGNVLTEETVECLCERQLRVARGHHD